MRKSAVIILAVGLLTSSGPAGGGQGDGGRTLERQKLEQDSEVQGVPCLRGDAWFDAAGRLASCFLSRQASIRNAELPSGSGVHLEPDGSLDYVFLPKDTSIQGHVCRGKGHDFMTTFHPNGKLKLCWLAGPEDIQGVPCGKATFFADVFGGGAGTYFHENGKLARCKLSRDATLEGRSVRRGEHVRLDSDGKLIPAD